MCIFAKKPTQNQLELAYSIGLGYPLIGCSSAEPISVSPNNTNVVKLLTDTVCFTLPQKGELYLLDLEAKLCRCFNESNDQSRCPL